MKIITFITTNQGKVKTLQSHLPKEYFVTNTQIELPEIQAQSASEVSIIKAKAAYEIIKKPLIVQDSSLHINVLNGFPGIYIKYILNTIGIEGILKLLEGVDDRSYYFEGALTYIENEDLIKTFICKSKPGTITESIDNIFSERAWSKVWQILIPYGKNKTLAALSNELQKENSSEIKDKSEFELFIEWLSSR